MSYERLRIMLTTLKAQLNIESLHDIVWDTGAFDKLIIQSEHKNLLQALTKSFKIKRQEWAEKDNIVNGKGNALIMLLHGAPGTGKTLTAEW
jgi:SpoVK/Ycf46/Vps4 family AAA+-type ATPase